MICQWTRIISTEKVIKSLSSQEILVHFPEEDKTIEVEKYEWQNIRYKMINKGNRGGGFRDFCPLPDQAGLGNYGA
jgi:hypothetical protein